MDDNTSDGLPPGHRIGRYRVERELGRGGFGITYLARERRLGWPVAIKEYYSQGWASRSANGDVVPTGGNEADFDWGLQRLGEEAKILWQVQHPNIARVHSYEEQGGTGYIVMEFVEGESLSKRLERHVTLLEPEIRQFILPIMDGLAEVHRNGFLHLDIAPKNIMLTPDGRGVLLDFGAARPTQRAAAGEATILITPSYAALEQHAGSSQSPATDVYSLGAVLYRCVTGHPPWHPARRVENDHMPRASDAKRRQVYDPSLLSMIDVALAVRQEDRPQSIADWQSVLSRSDNSEGRRTSYRATDRSECSDHELADGGDADAQYRLGLLAHWDGDWDGAASWYTRAADQEHAKAQFQLGMMCFRREIEGLEVEECVELAVGWCMFAADNGLDRARAFLERDIQAGVEAYRRGDHCEAELEFMRLAVREDMRAGSDWGKDPDSGEAKFRLAQMCMHRTICTDYNDRGAFDQACDWLRGASRNGCGRAESWLFALLSGHVSWWFNVEEVGLEDKAEGLDWYWKAAERSPAEQYDLGLRSEGDPDHADREEASFWYRLAADRGHVNAQFRLGLLAYCGVESWHPEGSLQEDEVSRLDWLRNAARNGHQVAQALLDADQETSTLFGMTDRHLFRPEKVAFPAFAVEMRAESEECAREPLLLFALYRSYREAATKAGVRWKGEFSTDPDIEAWYDNTE